LTASVTPALSAEASNYARLAFKSPAITDARPIVIIPAVATVFFCSVHSPPITQRFVSWRCAARRHPLRANTSAASRAAHGSIVCVCARSTRGSARPLAASPFLQSGRNKPALQSRKNGAAAARPPSSFGLFTFERSLPPPARGHAVCSGSCLAAAPAGRANVAPAPSENLKGMTLLLLPATRPRDGAGGAAPAPAPPHSGSLFPANWLYFLMEVDSHVQCIRYRKADLSSPATGRRFLRAAPRQGHTRVATP